MKTNNLVLLFFLSLFNCVISPAFTQQLDSSRVPEIFIITEVMPKPSDGIDAVFDWIKTNNKLYNIIQDDQKKNVVYVSFIIDTTGILNEFKIIKGIETTYDNEALRLLRECPIKWNPGLYRGVPVLVRQVLPVYFSDYRSIPSNKNSKRKK